MIIVLAGQRGVGKTTLAALILDEAARRNPYAPALAIDADPARRLHLALGLAEPAATVREAAEFETRLPALRTPAGYMLEQLAKASVLAKHRLRRMPLDLLAMGQGQSRNRRMNDALTTVLSWIIEDYSPVLIDSGPGLEQLNRRWPGRVDLFLAVAAPNPGPAQAVELAGKLGLETVRVWPVFNRVPPGFRPPSGQPAVVVPCSEAITQLEASGRAVVELDENDPVRPALRPVVERIFRQKRLKRNSVKEKQQCPKNCSSPLLAKAKQTASRNSPHP
jgi:CO dehydrogenase nickel-insertion accessory protein CooC1